VKPGASLRELLSVRQTEPIELVLQGSHDIEAGRADLRQPLQTLRPGAQGAARVKSPPILHLVPGREMPAGAPFAQGSIARIGGNEAGRLVRRALGKILGKRPRVDAAIELLLAKRHNPHCSYHIVYMFRWGVNRSRARLHRLEGLSHLDGAAAKQHGTARGSCFGLRESRRRPIGRRYACARPARHSQDAPNPDVRSRHGSGPAHHP